MKYGPYVHFVAECESTHADFGTGDLAPRGKKLNDALHGGACLVVTGFCIEVEGKCIDAKRGDAIALERCQRPFVTRSATQESQASVVRDEQRRRSLPSPARRKIMDRDLQNPPLRPAHSLHAHIFTHIPNPFRPCLPKDPAFHL